MAIKEDPVFRRITRHQALGTEALTPLAITHLLTRATMKAQLPNATLYTPHSLRRGLATSAARANTHVRIIMKAGRWKQVNTVMEYIEESARFEENAAATVLHKFNFTNT